MQQIWLNYFILFFFFFAISATIQQHIRHRRTKQHWSYALSEAELCKWAGLQSASHSVKSYKPKQYETPANGVWVSGYHSEEIWISWRRWCSNFCHRTAGTPVSRCNRRKCDSAHHGICGVHWARAQSLQINTFSIYHWLIESTSRNIGREREIKRDMEERVGQK